MTAEDLIGKSREQLLKIFFANGGTVTERGFKKPNIKLQKQACCLAIEAIKKKRRGAYFLGEIKEEFLKGRIDHRGQPF
jgi:hypothetical protein